MLRYDCCYGTYTEALKGSKNMQLYNFLVLVAAPLNVSEVELDNLMVLDAVMTSWDYNKACDVDMLCPRWTHLEKCQKCLKVSKCLKGHEGSWLEVSAGNKLMGKLL